MTSLRAVSALALLAVLLTAGCATGAQQPIAQAPGQAQTKPVPNKGVIVFDTAHGEIFAPDDTSELGQSSAVQKMKDSGYEVRVNSSAITSATLDGVAAVYLPGPMRPFSKDEETVIDDYLERGGTVVMSIHVPYPVLAMSARWGLPVRTGVMAITAEGVQGDPGVFSTTRIVEDPLTEGVQSVMIVSGWPVATDTTKLATAKLVVLAEGPVAADTNANGQYDAGDEQQPFGVVGVAPVGSGRVVVLGDDAIFANVGFGQADNAKLLENILKLISAPKGA